MFLYLEKLLPIFVYPIGLSVVLCLAAMALSIGRRPFLSRSLSGAAVLVLWVGSMPAFADLLTATLEDQNAALPVDRAASADVIVVLGGDIAAPRGPLAEPELGQAGDRVFAAYSLWRAGKAKTILVSGGDEPWADATRPEADRAAQALEALGMPAAAILTEGESRNTRENAVNSAALWRANGFRSGLLVTSAIHMPRALATFRAVGLDLIPFPSDFRGEYASGGLFHFLPDARALVMTTAAIKEWVGIAVYRWLGWA